MARPAIPASAEATDRDERARDAVKVFRSMLHGLNGYARAVTGDPKMRIEITNAAPHTDGKTIYYRPPIALGDKTPHVRSICGERDDVTGLKTCPACKVREEVLVNIYHEIAHIVFGTFAEVTPQLKRDALDKAIVEWGGKYEASIRARMKEDHRATRTYQGLSSLISPFLPYLVNCIEDARVDRSMFEARRGTKKMMQADTYANFRDGGASWSDERPKWHDAPLNSQISVACYLQAGGYEDWQQFLHPKIGEDIADAKVTEILASVADMTEVRETYLAAFPLMARLRELGYFQMPDDPDEDNNPSEEEPDDEQPEPEPEDGSDEQGGEEASGEAGSEELENDSDDDEASRDDDGRADEGSDEVGDDDPSSREGDSNDGAESRDGTPELDSGDGSEDAESDPADRSKDAESDSADAGTGSDGESPDSSEAGSDDAGSDEVDGDESEQQADDFGSGGGSGDVEDTGSESMGGSVGPGEGSLEGDAGEGSSGESASDGGGSGLPDDQSAQRDEASNRPDGDDPSEGDASQDDSQAEAGQDDGSEVDERADGNQGRVSDSDSVPSESDSQEEVPSTEVEAGAGASDTSAPVDSDFDSDQDPGSGDDRSGQADDAGVPDSVEYQGQSESDGRTENGDLDDDLRAEPSDEGSRPLHDGQLAEHEPAPSSEEGLADVSHYAEGEGVGPEAAPSDLDSRPEEPLPEYGDSFDVENDLAIIHSVSPDLDDTRADEDAISIAVVQGKYFDTSSQNVGIVNEYKANGPAYARFNDSKVSDDELEAFGIKVDPKVDEAIIGPALGRMRRIFTDNQVAGYQNNMRSGRINAKVLGKRAWGDDDRLFGKKRLPAKQSYAVLIGVDISSSTLGAELKLAKKAALAQAELCNRLGLKFTVYTHCANARMVGDEKMFSMDIYEIKSWSDAWDDKARTRLANIGFSGGNLDGHTMEHYRKKLDAVEATDKILMYYTDGAMPAANREEELVVLQREIKTCKKKNYTLMAVGIGTDSPIQHGLDTVQVDEETDLKKVVEHLGKRLKESVR